jgi:density-regulated protein
VLQVQGDVSAEIEEYILDHMKNVPEDNVELIEDKKKKGGGS